MTRFAEYTNYLVQRLPYWFSIKKDPYNSIGSLFLNVFGLELEDIEYILEYAYKQTRIDEMDINYIDKVYKAVLPNNISEGGIVSVESNQLKLTKANDLVDFFNIRYNPIENDHNYNEDVYMYDDKRKVIFVKKKYDKCTHFPDGKIIIRTKNNKIDVPLINHRVWNFFDEFGMLLECPRLENESNANYVKRIKDVFKNPGNASKNGFLNALARELNLRKTIIWEDCSKNLVLNEQMIVVNKITSNNEFVNISDIFINEQNKIVLKGLEELRGVSKEVSYVYGVEMHELHNKKDKKLNYELYYADGKPKELLTNYVNKIHNDMPIIWGKFKWGHGYWNITDKELGGIAYIPSCYDASVSGFEKYNAKGGVD